MAFALPGGMGGIVSQLIWQIITGIAICAAAVALFFIGKAIQKFRRKQKSFTIDSGIFDLNGVIDFDRVGFLKSEESGLLEMIFEKRANDGIPPVPKHLVRNGKVLLLNYAPGHYAVIDPSATINNFSQGKNEIVLYNLGMKKYIESKQREMLNKGEAKKKKWENWSPWITLGATILIVCVTIWIAVYVGGNLYSGFITDRVEECKLALRGGS